MCPHSAIALHLLFSLYVDEKRINELKDILETPRWHLTFHFLHASHLTSSPFRFSKVSKLHITQVKNH